MWEGDPALRPVARSSRVLALPPEKPSGETQGFQRGAQSLLLLLPPPLPGSPSHPAEPTSGIVPSNERNGPESGSPTAKTLRCRQVYHEATEFYGEIWQRHQEPGSFGETSEDAGAATGRQRRCRRDAGAWASRLGQRHDVLEI
ncbi:unnamed protein product [Lampetra planeri]